eukprot:TRINITY_DN7257_c0_g1_i2.p1 TRINITY_DN7257_c0_g1~~TRINITY_DN7257_c0_g1_i2.p1  ORF type:complete len:208 (+),score=50.26 TRINITY_DN7257_c0_g1_i2:3-626(+)
MPQLQKQSANRQQAVVSTQSTWVHNEKYGTSLSLADFHSYDFWKVWGGTREEATTKCYEFFQSAHFHNLSTVPYAFDALNSLKHKFQFVVVTSRQHDIAEATCQWLHSHYPDIFSDIRFGHHYGRVEDARVSRSKPELCAEVGASVIIDDSLVYAVQCSRTLKHVVLFDLDGKYPWNKTSEPLPANVTRVHSWLDAVQVLETLDFSS